MKVARLFGDNVIIKKMDTDTMTKGGLYIPSTVDAEKDSPFTYGTVVMVGEGRMVKGFNTPFEKEEMKCKEGDVVMYNKHAGEKIEGEKLVVLKEGDVLGIMDN